MTKKPYDLKGEELKAYRTGFNDGNESNYFPCLTGKKLAAQRAPHMIMETPDNKQTYVVRIYEKTERRYFDVSIRAETESAALAAIHHDFPLFRYAVHSLRRGKPWTLSELLTTKK